MPDKEDAPKRREAPPSAEVQPNNPSKYPYALVIAESLPRQATQVTFDWVGGADATAGACDVRVGWSASHERDEQSKYPPAEPGALELEPLKAAVSSLTRLLGFLAAQESGRRSR